MYHLFWTHFLGTNWCVLLVCHIKQYPCQCQLIAINQPLSMKGWSERLLKHVKKHRTHDSSSDGRLAGWFCRKQADTSPCCGWVDGEGVSDLCQDLVPVTWDRVWKWSGGKDSSLIAAGTIRDHLPAHTLLAEQPGVQVMLQGQAETLQQHPPGSLRAALTPLWISPSC